MKDTRQPLTVSIVIPAYNEEHHLKSCLSAISKQTVMPLEVIVVDNNSTDKTVLVANGFPFVRVISEQKQGRRAARTTGFNAVRGDIIGRIDADTYLPTDWVERVLAFYDEPEHTTQALTGGCAFYNVRLPRVDQWITSQFVFRMNRLMVGHYVLWGSNMALPQTLWLKVRGQLCHREDIHEDLDIAIHLHRLGYKINYQATLIVGAQMRRVFDNRRKLWLYLKMWPRTLKTHQIRGWPFSYAGAAFLYCMQIVPRSAEVLARAFGYSKLN